MLSARFSDVAVPPMSNEKMKRYKELYREAEAAYQGLSEVYLANKSVTEFKKSFAESFWFGLKEGFTPKAVIANPTRSEMARGVMAAVTQAGDKYPFTTEEEEHLKTVGDDMVATMAGGFVGDVPELLLLGGIAGGAKKVFGVANLVNKLQKGYKVIKPIGKGAPRLVKTLSYEASVPKGFQVVKEFKPTQWTKFQAFVLNNTIDEMTFAGIGGFQPGMMTGMNALHLPLVDIKTTGKFGYLIRPYLNLIYKSGIGGTIGMEGGSIAGMAVDALANNKDFTYEVKKQFGVESQAGKRILAEMALTPLVFGLGMQAVKDPVSMKQYILTEQRRYLDFGKQLENAGMVSTANHLYEWLGIRWDMTRADAIYQSRVNTKAMEYQSKPTKDIHQGIDIASAVIDKLNKDMNTWNPGDPVHIGQGVYRTPKDRFEYQAIMEEAQLRLLGLIKAYRNIKQTKPLTLQEKTKPKEGGIENAEEIPVDKGIPTPEAPELAGKETSEGISDKVQRITEKGRESSRKEQRLEPKEQESTVPVPKDQEVRKEQKPIQLTLFQEDQVNKVDAKYDKKEASVLSKLDGLTKKAAILTNIDTEDAKMQLKMTNDAIKAGEFMLANIKNDRVGYAQMELKDKKKELEHLKSLPPDKQNEVAITQVSEEIVELSDYINLKSEQLKQQAKKISEPVEKKKVVEPIEVSKVTPEKASEAKTKPVTERKPTLYRKTVTGTKEEIQERPLDKTGAVEIKSSKEDYIRQQAEQGDLLAQEVLVYRNETMQNMYLKEKFGSQAQKVVFSGKKGESEMVDLKESARSWHEDKKKAEDFYAKKPKTKEEIISTTKTYAKLRTTAFNKQTHPKKHVDLVEQISQKIKEKQPATVTGILEHAYKEAVDFVTPSGKRYRMVKVQNAEEHILESKPVKVIMESPETAESIPGREVVEFEGKKYFKYANADKLYGPELNVYSQSIDPDTKKPIFLGRIAQTDFKTETGWKSNVPEEKPLPPAAKLPQTKIEKPQPELAVPKEQITPVTETKVNEKINNVFGKIVKTFEKASDIPTDEILDISEDITSLIPEDKKKLLKEGAEEIFKEVMAMRISDASNFKNLVDLTKQFIQAKEEFNLLSKNIQDVMLSFMDDYAYGTDKTMINIRKKLNRTIENEVDDDLSEASFSDIIKGSEAKAATQRKKYKDVFDELEVSGFPRAETMAHPILNEMATNGSLKNEDSFYKYLNELRNKGNFENAFARVLGDISRIGYERAKSMAIIYESMGLRRYSAAVIDTKGNVSVREINIAIPKSEFDKQINKTLGVKAEDTVFKYSGLEGERALRTFLVDNSNLRKQGVYNPEKQLEADRQLLEKITGLSWNDLKGFYEFNLQHGRNVAEVLWTTAYGARTENSSILSARSFLYDIGPQKQIPNINQIALLSGRQNMILPDFRNLQKKRQSSFVFKHQADRNLENLINEPLFNSDFFKDNRFLNFYRTIGMNPKPIEGFVGIINQWTGSVATGQKSQDKLETNDIEMTDFYRFVMGGMITSGENKKVKVYSHNMGQDSDRDHMGYIDAPYYEFKEAKQIYESIRRDLVSKGAYKFVPKPISELQKEAEDIVKKFINQKTALTINGVPLGNLPLGAERVKLALNFLMNYTINQHDLLQLTDGDISQYKDMDEFGKRRGITTARGYVPLLGIDGGLPEKTRAMVVPDVRGDVKLIDERTGEELVNLQDLEISDGSIFASLNYLKQQQISLGADLNRIKFAPDYLSEKAVQSFTNPDGTVIKIKGHTFSIEILAELFPDGNWAKYARLMKDNNVDKLIPLSSAKKHGGNASFVFDEKGELIPDHKIKIIDLDNRYLSVQLDLRADWRATEAKLLKQIMPIYFNFPNSRRMLDGLNEAQRISAAEKLNELTDISLIDKTKFLMEKMSQSMKVLSDIFGKYSDDPNLLSHPLMKDFVNNNLGFVVNDGVLRMNVNRGRYTLIPDIDRSLLPPRITNDGKVSLGEIMITGEGYTDYTNYKEGRLREEQVFDSLDDAKKYASMFDDMKDRDGNLLEHEIREDKGKFYVPGEVLQVGTSPAHNFPSCFFARVKKLLPPNTKNWIIMNNLNQFLAGKDADGDQMFTIGFYKTFYGKALRGLQELQKRADMLLDYQRKDVAVENVFRRLFGFDWEKKYKMNARTVREWLSPEEHNYFGLIPKNTKGLSADVYKNFENKLFNYLRDFVITGELPLTGVDPDHLGDYNIRLKSYPSEFMPNKELYINNFLREAMNDSYDSSMFPIINRPIDKTIFDDITNEIESGLPNQSPLNHSDYTAYRIMQMHGVDMKGLVTNASTIISYLSKFDVHLKLPFNIPDITAEYGTMHWSNPKNPSSITFRDFSKDDLNIAKEIIGDVLNMVYDGPKNPRAERQGNNEFTNWIFAMTVAAAQDVGLVGGGTLAEKKARVIQKLKPLVAYMNLPEVKQLVRNLRNSKTVLGGETKHEMFVKTAVEFGVDKAYADAMLKYKNVIQQNIDLSQSDYLLNAREATSKTISVKKAKRSLAILMDIRKKMLMGDELNNLMNFINIGIETPTDINSYLQARKLYDVFFNNRSTFIDTSGFANGDKLVNDLAQIDISLKAAEDIIFKDAVELSPSFSYLYRTFNQAKVKLSGNKSAVLDTRVNGETDTLVKEFNHYIELKAMNNGMTINNLRKYINLYVSSLKNATVPPMAVPRAPQTSIKEKTFDFVDNKALEFIDILDGKPVISQAWKGTVIPDEALSEIRKDFDRLPEELRIAMINHVYQEYDGLSTGSYSNNYSLIFGPETHRWIATKVAQEHALWKNNTIGENEVQKALLWIGKKFPDYFSLLDIEPYKQLFKAIRPYDVNYTKSVMQHLLRFKTLNEAYAWANQNMRNDREKELFKTTASEIAKIHKTLAAQGKLEQKDAIQKENDFDGLLKFETSDIPGYPDRTYKNASADYTIAIATNFDSAGEILTRKAVREQKGEVSYIPIQLGEYLFIMDNEIKRVVSRINGLPNKGTSVNIAGNSLKTFAAKFPGITQQQVDEFVKDTLYRIYTHPDLIYKPSLLRCGGQSGVDEAGAKAGLALQIKTLIYGPKDWKYIDESGNTVSDVNKFKARFGVEHIEPQVKDIPPMPFRTFLEKAIDSEVSLLDTDGIVNPYKNLKELKRDIETGNIDIPNKHTAQTVIDIVTKMQEKVNIPILFVSDPFSGAKAKLKKIETPEGISFQAEFNLAKATPSSAFHEFLHPILSYIKGVSPETYTRFIDELKQTPEWTRVHKDLLDRYAIRFGIKEIPEELANHPYILNEVLTTLEGFRMEKRHALKQLNGNLTNEQKGDLIKSIKNIKGLVIKYYNIVHDHLSKLMGNYYHAITAEDMADMTLGDLEEMIDSDRYAWKEVENHLNDTFSEIEDFTKRLKEIQENKPTGSHVVQTINMQSVDQVAGRIETKNLYDKIVDKFIDYVNTSIKQVANQQGSIVTLSESIIRKHLDQFIANSYSVSESEYVPRKVNNELETLNAWMLQYFHEVLDPVYRLGPNTTGKISINDPVVIQLGKFVEQIRTQISPKYANYVRKLAYYSLGPVGKALMVKKEGEEIKYSHPFADWLHEQNRVDPNRNVNLTQPFPKLQMNKYQYAIAEDFRNKLLNQRKSKSLPVKIRFSDMAIEFNKYFQNEISGYGLSALNVNDIEFYAINNILYDRTQTGNVVLFTPNEFLTNFPGQFGFGIHPWSLNSLKLNPTTKSPVTRFNPSLAVAGLGWYNENRIGKDIILHEFQDEHMTKMIDYIKEVENFSEKIINELPEETNFASSLDLESRTANYISGPPERLFGKWNPTIPMHPDTFAYDKVRNLMKVRQDFSEGFQYEFFEKIRNESPDALSIEDLRKRAILDYKHHVINNRDSWTYRLSKDLKNRTELKVQNRILNMFAKGPSYQYDVIRRIIESVRVRLKDNDVETYLKALDKKFRDLFQNNQLFKSVLDEFYDEYTVSYDHIISGRSDISNITKFGSESLINNISKRLSESFFLLFPLDPGYKDLPVKTKVAGRFEIRESIDYVLNDMKNDLDFNSREIGRSQSELMKWDNKYGYLSRDPLAGTKVMEYYIKQFERAKKFASSVSFKNFTPTTTVTKEELLKMVLNEEDTKKAEHLSEKLNTIKFIHAFNKYKKAGVDHVYLPDEMATGYMQHSYLSARLYRSSQEVLVNAVTDFINDYHAYGEILGATPNEEMIERGKSLEDAKRAYESAYEILKPYFGTAPGVDESGFVDLNKVIIYDADGNVIPTLIFDAIVNNKAFRKYMSLNPEYVPGIVYKTASSVAGTKIIYEKPEWSRIRLLRIDLKDYKEKPTELWDADIPNPFEGDPVTPQEKTNKEKLIDLYHEASERHISPYALRMEQESVSALVEKYRLEEYGDISLRNILDAVNNTNNRTIDEILNQDLGFSLEDLDKTSNYTKIHHYITGLKKGQTEIDPETNEIMPMSIEDFTRLYAPEFGTEQMEAEYVNYKKNLQTCINICNNPAMFPQKLDMLLNERQFKITDLTQIVFPKIVNTKGYGTENLTKFINLLGTIKLLKDISDREIEHGMYKLTARALHQLVRKNQVGELHELDFPTGSLMGTWLLHRSEVSHRTPLIQLHVKTHDQFMESYMRNSLKFVDEFYNKYSGKDKDFMDKLVTYGYTDPETGVRNLYDHPVFLFPDEVTPELFGGDLEKTGRAKEFLVDLRRWMETYIPEYIYSKQVEVTETGISKRMRLPYGYMGQTEAIQKFGLRHGLHVHQLLAPSRYDSIVVEGKYTFREIKRQFLDKWKRLGIEKDESVPSEDTDELTQEEQDILDGFFTEREAMDLQAVVKPYVPPFAQSIASATSKNELIKTLNTARKVAMRRFASQLRGNYSQKTIPVVGDGYYIDELESKDRWLSLYNHVHSHLFRYAFQELLPLGNWLMDAYRTKKSPTAKWVTDEVTKNLLLINPDDSMNVYFMKVMKTLQTMSSLAYIGFKLSTAKTNKFQGTFWNLLVHPTETLKGMNRVYNPAMWIMQNETKFIRYYKFLSKHGIGTIVDETKVRGEAFRALTTGGEKLIGSSFWVEQLTERANQIELLAGLLTPDQDSAIDSSGDIIDSNKLPDHEVEKLRYLIKQVHGEYGIYRGHWSHHVVGRVAAQFTLPWLYRNFRNTFGKRYIDMYGQEFVSLFGGLNSALMKIAYKTRGQESKKKLIESIKRRSEQGFLFEEEMGDVFQRIYDNYESEGEIKLKAGEDLRTVLRGALALTSYIGSMYMMNLFKDKAANLLRGEEVDFMDESFYDSVRNINYMYLTPEEKRQYLVNMILMKELEKFSRDAFIFAHPATFIRERVDAGLFPTIGYASRLMSVLGGVLKTGITGVPDRFEAGNPWVAKNEIKWLYHLSKITPLWSAYRSDFVPTNRLWNMELEKEKLETAKYGKVAKIVATLTLNMMMFDNIIYDQDKDGAIDENVLRKYYTENNEEIWKRTMAVWDQTTMDRLEKVQKDILDGKLPDSEALIQKQKYLREIRHFLDNNPDRILDSLPAMTNYIDKDFLNTIEGMYPENKPPYEKGAAAWPAMKAHREGNYNIESNPFKLIFDSKDAKNIIEQKP
jgi:hypothetical protein